MGQWKCFSIFVDWHPALELLQMGARVVAEALIMLVRGAGIPGVGQCFEGVMAVTIGA
jgi:hypothetical protein